MPNIKELNEKIELFLKLLSITSKVSRFPIELENEFQRNYLKNFSNASRLTLLLGFFLFSLGSIFIVLFFQDWFFPFSVSIFMVSPVLAVLLVFCYTKLYIQFQQIIVFLFATTILIGLAIIAALAPVPLKDLVYQGMLLPPLFTSTLANLQFRYAIFIMLAVMILSNISYHFSGFLADHNYYSFWVNNYLLFGGSSLCLIASYFTEGYHRKQFLLGKVVLLKNNLLEYISNYDELTNVANRRYFNETLEREWRRAKRESQPLGLIFIDFDYFKQYNDLYGHLSGDKALYTVAQALTSCARRPGDFVARYGGDEFIMLLPNIALEAALEVAQKVQLTIKNLALPHAESKLSKFVTVTIGVTSLIPNLEATADLLLKQADITLNYGKKNKRNAIYMYLNGTVAPYLHKVPPS